MLATEAHQKNKRQNARSSSYSLGERVLSYLRRKKNVGRWVGIRTFLQDTETCRDTFYKHFGTRSFYQAWLRENKDIAPKKYVDLAQKRIDGSKPILSIVPSPARNVQVANLVKDAPVSQPLQVCYVGEQSRTQLLNIVRKKFMVSQYPVAVERIMQDLQLIDEDGNALSNLTLEDALRAFRDEGWRGQRDNCQVDRWVATPLQVKMEQANILAELRRSLLGHKRQCDQDALTLHATDPTAYVQRVAASASLSESIRRICRDEERIVQEISALLPAPNAPDPWMIQKLMELKNMSIEQIEEETRRFEDIRLFLRQDKEALLAEVYAQMDEQN